jgi:hypothetical protein
LGKRGYAAVVVVAVGVSLLFRLVVGWTHVVVVDVVVVE